MTESLKDIYTPIHMEIISILSNNPNVKVEILDGEKNIFNRFYRITIKNKTKSFWEIFKPKFELVFTIDIHLNYVQTVAVTGCNIPSGNTGYYITQYLPTEQYIPLLTQLISNETVQNSSWIESERINCIMDKLKKL